MDENININPFLPELKTFPIKSPTGRNTTEKAIKDSKDMLVRAFIGNQNRIGRDEIKLDFVVPPTGGQLVKENYSYTLPGQVNPLPTINGIRGSGNLVVLKLSADLVAAPGNGTITCRGQFENETLGNYIIGPNK